MTKPAKPVPKKAVTKRAAPKPLASAVDSVNTLYDEIGPDVPVSTLLTHSERLAHTIETLAEPLRLAKVSVHDAATMRAHVAQLRTVEDAWQVAWAKGAPGSVARARASLTEGREDLFGALRVFADQDADTQRQLDEIAGIEGDDDLDSDVTRLIPLAQKHAPDLDGTEVTPERVDEIAKLLTDFRAARAGAREVAEGGTTQQALTEAARVALQMRNRAFWALATINRRVCARARFRFRRDPKRKAEFTAYGTERVGGAKTAAKADPPATS